MFKKVLFAALAAALSFNVMADDKPLSFQVLSITDKVVDNKEIKIVVKDQKGGVYVSVRSGWSSIYPKTAKLISDILAANGVKIANDPATADIGLQFAPGYGFNFEDVESQTSNWDTTKIGAGVGAVLGGGVFGVVAMLGSNTDKPVNSLFLITSVEKPSISGSRGFIAGDNKIELIPTVRYQSNKTGFEVSNLVFKAMIEDFINKHVVLDTAVPAADSVAASSVPATIATEAK